MSGLAVVLGGGGSAGVAWEIGVVHGLAEGGVGLRSADLLVGTSAGSIVAVRMCSGASTARLFEEVCRPVGAVPMDLDYHAVEAGWAGATVGATSAADARRRIGDLALAAETMTPAQRRSEIAALLPSLEWPERPLVVTAVNTADGEAAWFDRGSEVSLLDAVSASCAVPGVWPPVEVLGTPYMDGAVRSTINADLAAGHERVLVLAPLAPIGGVARELGRLPEGTRHLAIEADERSLATFGSNPLDPRTGPAAAREGYRQGLAQVSAAAAVVTPA
jgi:NTE family protein